MNPWSGSLFCLTITAPQDISNIPLVVMLSSSAKFNTCWVSPDIFIGLFEANKLISNKSEYKRMAEAKNPFGDGKSSKRILDKCLKYLEISE